MLADEADIARTAARFGVSYRTLRFYEQIGLIAPLRRGMSRAYTGSDHVRLQLIATGKRLGLSLAQIRDLIDEKTSIKTESGSMIPDAEHPSIAALLTKGEIEQQLQILERQRSDLEESIAELHRMREAIPSR